MDKPIILCIDDEAISRQMLAQQLTPVVEPQYCLEILADVQQGLERTAQLRAIAATLPLIICNIFAESQQTLALLNQITVDFPESYLLLLRAPGTCPEVSGNVYRYLEKPWYPPDLILTVKTALMSYDTLQELKQRESELAQLRHEQAQLKTTLQKKERLLAQTQLQMLQTEKMSSLGEMLAGITHEINNPINFISGGIRCLDEYMQDISKLLVLYERYYQDVPPDIQTLRDEVNVDYLLGDTQKLLASMRQTTEILKNISRSVRNFARADQPGKVNINLHDGIETALMILSFRLKAAPSRPAIQIHRQYGELPLVTAYPTQMNQVFLNILVNAIDALEETNEGREYLEIEAHPNQIWITTQYDAERSVVQVKIRDNGGGVPESIQERVFDNLFTTKSRDRGTGIGLFISRQIIEETHQGHLHFTSALGEGTEFIIELPVQ